MGAGIEVVAGWHLGHNRVLVECREMPVNFLSAR